MDGIRIYLPPEFTGLTRLMANGFYDTANIWTSITADYRDIHISVARPYDPIAPLWTRITILPVTNWLPQLNDLEFGRPVGTPVGIAPGNYTIKLFNLRSPNIVGRYFFKVFAAPDSGGTGKSDFASIGAPNFPTLVVAAGPQPNFITGRLLNALTGGPISAPGRVLVTGTTQTGQQIQGQAYFNTTANGAYTVYGLPDGAYTITAIAAGFTPSQAVSVNLATGGSAAGVSAPSINMFPAGSITLNIVSKELSTGLPIPWSISRTLWIEVLSAGGAVLAVHNASKVNPSSTTHSFTFNSVALDGHIPQDSATYIDGLSGANFLVSARIAGYIELQPTPISVPFAGGLGGGQFSAVLNVFRGGSFNVTLQFKRFATDLVLLPTPTTRFAVVEAIDQNRQVRGWTLRQIPAGTTTITIPVIGIALAIPGIPGVEGFFPRFRDVEYLDYGLASGTYTLRISMTDFLQATSPAATVSGTSTASVSIDMVLGATLTANAVSRTATSFTPLANWQFPGAPITLSLIQPGGGLAGFARSSQPASGSTAAVTLRGVNFFDLTGGTTFYFLGHHDTTLRTGDYTVRIETPGYIQNREMAVSLSAGSTSAIGIDVLIGSFIGVNALFTTEGLFAPGGATRFRAEVFDSAGRLVGATAGMLQPTSGGISLQVIGFNQYAGGPLVRYANFYDTTDGAFQLDRGILPGTYQVRLTVSTFLVGEATVQTIEATTASASITLSKLGRLHGRVLGLRPLFGTTNLIPLSWAIVDAGGGVFTLSQDGDYEIWLPPAVYSITYSHPDYRTAKKSVTIGPGSDVGIDTALISQALVPPAPTTTATTAQITTSSITTSLVTVPTTTATATQTAAGTKVTSADSSRFEPILVLVLVVALAGVGVAVAIAGRRLF